MLGFSDVVRDARGYVTSSTPATTPGYILTRYADKYGRAVAPWPTPDHRQASPPASVMMSSLVSQRWACTSTCRSCGRQ